MAQRPLHFVVADGLTLGESEGEPVLIVRKAGLPVLGVPLPSPARAALVAALEAFALDEGGLLPAAPLPN
jgi:hypothetical protein